MNLINAVRAFSPPDLASLRDAAASLSSGRPGGISANELEKLGSAADSLSIQPPAAKGSGDFGNVLGQMVQEVQAKQAQASAAMTGVLAGDGVPLHEAVLASEEASVAFQLMVEVRNKLLESYQELMRMQV
ncbi:MAG: flagellar hook-basal body complex protein FliE [Verrucomicrobiales bacterium]|nr:flagellar hook-basal body complex protein FliE [Verrucomicrobiales bacterium]